MYYLTNKGIELFEAYEGPAKNRSRPGEFWGDVGRQVRGMFGKVHRSEGGHSEGEPGALQPGSGAKAARAVGRTVAAPFKSIANVTRGLATSKGRFRRTKTGGGLHGNPGEGPSAETAGTRSFKAGEGVRSFTRGLFTKGDTTARDRETRGKAETLGRGARKLAGGIKKAGWAGAKTLRRGAVAGYEGLGKVTQDAGYGTLPGLKKKPTTPTTGSNSSWYARQGLTQNSSRVYARIGTLIGEAQGEWPDTDEYRAELARLRKRNPRTSTKVIPKDTLDAVRDKIKGRRAAAEAGGEATSGPESDKQARTRANVADKR